MTATHEASERMTKEYLRKFLEQWWANKDDIVNALYELIQQTRDEAFDEAVKIADINDLNGSLQGCRCSKDIRALKSKESSND